jgi:hypothetical protein
MQNITSEIDANSQEKSVYLVIEQPQTIPENFSYLDIAQAIFAIISPSLSLDLYSGRDDNLYSKITKEKAKNGYRLAFNAAANNGVIEDFIGKNEIKPNYTSVFKKFDAYFQEDLTPDKYTQQKFSKMLLDEVLDIAKKILDHLVSKKLVNIEKINWNTYFYLLNNMFALHMSACLQQKKMQITKSLQTQLDDTFLRRDYQEKNHQGVAQRANKINTDIPAGCLIDAALAQYKQDALLRISLGVSPTITQKEIELQKNIYSNETEARDQLLLGDEGYRQSAKEQLDLLGLKEGESYIRFICDPYHIPQNAFNFPQSINSISAIDIFNHCLMSNIVFLKQIDKKKCDPKIYKMTIKRLWAAFIADPRCPEKIKLRCKDFDPIIKLSKTNSESESESQLIIKIINRLFYPNPEKSPYYHGRILLKRITELFKKNNPSTPAFMQSISDELCALLTTLIQSKYKEDHALARKFIQVLSANKEVKADKEVKNLKQKLEKLQKTRVTPFSTKNSNGLTAMKNVLECSCFSAKQKIDLHDTIAKKQRSKIATPFSKKHSFYKQCAKKLKKRNELEKYSGLPCSQAQLDTLKNHLEAILKNQPQDKSSYSFFPTKEAIYRTDFKCVIEKIEQKKPAAEILLALMIAGKNSGGKFIENTRPDHLCKFINDFFAHKKTEQNEETLKTLLENIQQLKPEVIESNSAHEPAPTNTSNVNSFWSWNLPTSIAAGYQYLSTLLSYSTLP